MTSEQLKNKLLVSKDGLDFIKEMFPPETDDALLAILNGMDDSILDLLLPIFRIVNPTLSKEKLTASLTKAIKVLGMIKGLIESGDADEISKLCVNVSKNPLQLWALSRLV